MAAVTADVNNRSIHVISHGPGCLDGLVCAVVVAHNFADSNVSVSFEPPRGIDKALRDYRPSRPSECELWITDISWKDAATDAHLNDLIDKGLRLVWIDHHKSAADRLKECGLTVNASHWIMDMDRAASRITWDYLSELAPQGSRQQLALEELGPLVAIADDVDRWVLEISGSRKLGMAMSAMDQEDAFDALLEVDSALDWPLAIQDAISRVGKEVDASMSLATRTLATAVDQEHDLTVVSAHCRGYSGEIAERWKTRYERAVFALYDRRASAISLRRTNDCPIDLAQLATGFGGGGHSAAAGFDPPADMDTGSQSIAELLVDRLAASLNK